MDLKIIPGSSYKRAAWKNGLGTTAEIAIFPENATLKEGNFLWRLSSARIEKSSPFSEFPSHDRTLVILEGKGIRLFHTFEEGEPPEVIELPLFQSYDFPGDVPSRCELIEGAVTDFSVFIRKAEAEAMTEVQKFSAETSYEWIPAGVTNFAFAVRGSFEISAPHQSLSRKLSQGDTLGVNLGSPLSEGESIQFRSIQGEGVLILVSIQHGMGY